MYPLLRPLLFKLDPTRAHSLAMAALAPVEHLEAYAVARACQTLGVPCTIVLGIANIVGAKGREQWRARHVEASARAAEVAFAALPAIGI